MLVAIGDHPNPVGNKRGTTELRQYVSSEPDLALKYNYQRSPPLAGFSATAPDASASDGSYSDASASDTNYSNTSTSEAVKAHNRGLAHVQKSV